jgi:hypothetical protein
MRTLLQSASILLDACFLYSCRCINQVVTCNVISKSHAASVSTRTYIMLTIYGSGRIHDLLLVNKCDSAYHNYCDCALSLYLLPACRLCEKSTFDYYFYSSLCSCKHELRMFCLGKGACEELALVAQEHTHKPLYFPSFTPPPVRISCWLHVYFSSTRMKSSQVSGATKISPHIPAQQ